MALQIRYCLVNRKSNCSYEYKTTSNYDVLTINISLSKYEECNQDNIFNDVIAIVSKLETSKTLSYPDILEINKFLRLAKHTKVLDIRDYLIDNNV